MYVKSLTMKGFKSFADPTSLDFEEGVTVVVGPNGSGKSNVIDAIAWVFGAQGPRVVRSAKMDDVIFAGTSRRAALGRAEVSITIDNAAGRLPIAFSEVTVTRTLFRSGESEYAINGSPCRLLDVQELLSDSGIGRQQHVIISQGQLDTVLSARPEDRRAIIEEAAGVLKYRRRRERAERRLESSEAALERLEDLLREVRRQIRPLERQADAAKRHGALASELRALSAYLAGNELASVESHLEELARELEQTAVQLATRQHELGEVSGQLDAAEAAIESEQSDELGATIGNLERLAERARGLQSLIDERRRSQIELNEALSGGRSVEVLTDALGRIDEDLARADTAEGELERSFASLTLEEQSHERANADYESEYGALDETNEQTTLARAQARAASDLIAERKRALEKSRVRTEELARRKHAAAARADELENEIRDGEDELSEERARGDLASQTAHASARAREESAARLRAAEDAEHRLQARVEALEIALEEVRNRSGIGDLDAEEGVLGTLLEVIEVDERYGLALSAAIEGSEDAVVIDGAARAKDALVKLHESGLPAHVLTAPQMPSGSRGAVIAGTTRLIDYVSGPVGVRPILEQLIGEVLVTDASFSACIDLALSAPGATIVTLEGDRFSPRGWRIGQVRSSATRAALIDARDKLEGASAAAALAREAHETAERAAREDETRSSALEKRVSELRVSIDALSSKREDVARELARLGEDERVAQQEETTLAESLAEAEAALASLTGRLFVLEAEEADRERRSGEAAEARRALDEQGARLTRARRDLELRAATLRERRTLLHSRRDELSRELAEREAEDEATRARVADGGNDEVVLTRLEAELARVLRALDDAHRELLVIAEQRQLAARERREELARLRARKAESERAVESLRARHQRMEIDAAETRVRHEALLERIERELEMTPEEARAAEAPEITGGRDYETRRVELHNELEKMGPINPLAASELDEAMERSSFLEKQLEDIKSARRELNHVIAAIDKEIVEVFESAFADVARHFSDLVTTLFPGGSGALSLTMPNQLLETGVEIEARPAGRNVRRLSLLSGGERSLVALAFLFAVYRSRPSPFYVMDEVEAALDEINLARFLDLIEQFRDEAQLIIVSHQKKTMEIADALYGISMQPGGGSKVVSEKLRARNDRPAGVA